MHTALAKYDSHALIKIGTRRWFLTILRNSKY